MLLILGLYGFGESRSNQRNHRTGLDLLKFHAETYRYYRSSEASGEGSASLFIQGFSLAQNLSHLSRCALAILEIRHKVHDLLRSHS